MARSESEHIENIKGRKEITVKKKLIDKINSLGAESTTSPKELTYLSKSLEVLNKQIRDTTSYTSDEPKVNSTDNRPIRYDQQQVPNNAMPNWNVGRNQARNSTSAQFGVYTSHYAWSCGNNI